MIPLILLHPFRKSIQVIIHTYDSGLPIDGLLVADFKLQARHGRFLRGYDNILQKQVAVCSPEILDIEALDLDLFDQLHPVGVQRIQNIHQIMMLFMGGGIIQHKQWIEFLQGFLRLFAAHFLRFVQNHNGPVGLDHIDGPASAKILRQLHVDPSGILTPGIEGLYINNHNRKICAGTESVNVRQIFGVIHKEPCLFPVLLHEVILHHLETLLHSFPDGNGGDYHNELAPPILLIQLEHGLDVNIGLSCTRFHFHIQRAGPHMLCQRRRFLNIAAFLDFPDVMKKLCPVQRNRCVGKPHEKLFIRLLPVKQVAIIILAAYIPPVTDPVLKGLAGEYSDYAVYSIRLITLYGKFKFHGSHITAPSLLFADYRYQKSARSLQPRCQS